VRLFYSAKRIKRASLPVTYQQGPVLFCCARLCQWWGRLVGFGVRDCSASTDCGVNLYFDRPQANGSTAVELVPIDHCPFCGAPVETVRVK
jgi:hypothetical protein